MCKTKRQISLVLAALMLLASFGYSGISSVFADEPSASEWTEDDFFTTGLVLNGLKESGKNKLTANGGHLEIPVLKTSLGNQISIISHESFKNLGIKSLKIADGIETINMNAFYNNEIEELVLPNSITEVRPGAFKKNKIKDLTLSENMQIIYPSAFGDNLIKEVNIPKSVTEIRVNAFENNPGDPEQDNKVILNIFDLSKIDFKYDDMGADRYVIKIIKQKNDDEFVPSDFTFEEKVYSLTDGSTVSKNTLTGFSEEGKEKLKTLKNLNLPAMDTNGKPVEVVGSGAFQGNLGSKTINSLIIPEGYEFIDAMAFAFCGIEGDLKLPQSLDTLGGAVFFRNEISSVNIPSKIKVVPLSAFRGNKLKTLNFEGDIEEIGRLAFAENNLEEITVPDSLKTIGVQAFTTNTGNANFEDKLVIRTKSGTNPNNLQDSENYIIDPVGSGTPPQIDYNKWLKEDFSFENQTVTGFSEKGLRKVKKNKNLVVPDTTPDDKPIKIIGIDAFRNLNSGFDIETVELPDTVEIIEDYAFQFNSIEKFKMPRDLKRMGYGVLMMTGLKDIEWNEKIEEIDQICFYESELGDITIPKSVKYIRDASFRKSGLTSLKFEDGSALEEIDRLAFADNELKSLELPEGLVRLKGDQIFANNRITKIQAPDSLKDLGFQTFLENPGVSEYGNKVVVETKNSNANNLPDDMAETYIVDPEIKPSDEQKQSLNELIKNADKVDQEKLTDGSKKKSSNEKENNKNFKENFSSVLDEAKNVAKNDDSSKAGVLRVTNNLDFYLNRAKLNELMFTLDEMKKSEYDPDDWHRAVVAYAEADKKIMVYNLSKDALKKLERDLDVAIKKLKGIDPLADAKKYSGEAMVEKTHYIEPYTIKVNVWVKDGIILQVEDNGTVSDDPNEDHEHNAGYWNKAKEIMINYEGKSVEDVLKKNLSENGIDAISQATISSNVIHLAVRDAVSKSDEASKINLIYKINEAKAINKSDYTDSSVNELNKKIAEAEQIRDKSDASKDEMDKAAQELDKAIKSLVKKSGNSGNSSSDNSSSGNSSSDNSSSGNSSSDNSSRNTSSRNDNVNIDNNNNTPLDNPKKDNEDKTTKKLPFIDVKDDYWAYNSISYVYFNNIFKGVSEDRFAPEDKLSRAMFVTVLFRLSGEEKVDFKNSFKDVESTWYEDALNWAVKNEIVNGMNDTTFAPNLEITREQMVKIMFKYAEHKKFDTKKSTDITKYKDSEKISDYAVEPMKWSIANGIINGMTAETIAPQDTASRAQATAIIERFSKIFK